MVVRSNLNDQKLLAGRRQSVLKIERWMAHLAP